MRGEGAAGDAVAAAYDAIAAEYDRQLEGDAWMRRILWRRYAETFRPGQHVLDVGCGTGTDAIFLAQRGIRVTAIDISPAMVARAESKIAEHGLTDRVRVMVLSIDQLATLPAGELDGIISSFAALNTLPTLAPFAEDAARLLRPEGRMILHLLNGSSLWEWAGLVAHGRWTEARQLGARRERIFHVGERPVRHYTPRADEVYADSFANHFRLCAVSGLGIVWPPRPLPEPLTAALGRLDEWVAPHHPFIDWGRFVLLGMVKAGNGSNEPQGRLHIRTILAACQALIARSRTRSSPWSTRCNGPCNSRTGRRLRA